MPTCATITQPRPRRTLCPICTRLSRREPAPITVSCNEPRSIVVLAPTSTSSSRITRPSCGTREEAVRRDGEAEALLADARAGIDIDPRAEQRVRQAGMRADAAVGAEHHPVADHRARADAAARPDLRAGADHRQRPDLGAGVDGRAGCDDRAGMDAGPERRQRMEQRGDPRPGDVRLVGDDRPPQPAGTRAAMSGCTITAPALRSPPARGRYLRLSRKLTSPGPAVCSGATPVSISRRGGASPSAASATAASACGPARWKKRGSPAISGQSRTRPAYFFGGALGRAGLTAVRRGAARP